MSDNGGEGDTGGGFDNGACKMDPAVCTEITFSKNTDHVGAYHDDGGHTRSHIAASTSICGRAYFKVAYFFAILFLVMFVLSFLGK